MADTMSATRLLLLNEKVSALTMKRFENRPMFTEIGKMFKESSTQAQELMQLKQRRQGQEQSTYLEYIKQLAVTLTNTKVAAPSGDQLTTDKKQVVWLDPIVATVDVDISKLVDNDFDFVTIMADAMIKLQENIVWRGTGSVLNAEKLQLKFLTDNKTTVNAISGGGSENTWNGTTNQVETTIANKDRFWRLAAVDMMKNDYTPFYYDLQNTENMGIMRDVLYPGGGATINATNEFNEFKLFKSNLIDPTTFLSRHFIIPEGGIGRASYTLNDKQGARVFEKNFANVFRTVMPMTYPGYEDCAVDVKFYEQNKDTAQSSGGGKTDSAVLTIEMSLQLALYIAPLSTSGESSIFDYVQKKS